MCTHKCVCVNACQVCTGTCRDQKIVSDPLELGSQMVVSCQLWDLGSGLGYSAKVPSILSFQPNLLYTLNNHFTP